MQNTLKSWLFVAPVALCAAVAVWFGISPEANAVPPLLGWQFQEVIPADGAMDAPINGVVVARRYNDSGWPDEETVRQTVVPTLFRGADEPVEGTIEVDVILEEVRFVAARPLAEGVAYTFQLELLNEQLPSGGFNEVITTTFTTGNLFDEAPPAFSGIQDLSMTQTPQSVRECCEPSQEFCETSPGRFCEWCWIVDWAYPPTAEISFRAGEDEFGANTASYLLYRVEGPEDTEGELLRVLRVQAAGERVAQVVFDADDPGPFCFLMEAVDIYGRSTNNGAVLCRTLEDIVPVEAREVPPEDRSNCADFNQPEPDAGMDADDDDDPDVSDDEDGDDAGVEPDVPGEDEDPQLNSPSGDDGCGCHTPASPAGGSWPAGLALLLATGWLVWRRRGALTRGTTAWTPTATSTGPACAHRR